MTYKLKLCQHCGKEYQSTNSNQKYCVECGPVVHRIRIAEWDKANPEKRRASSAKQRKEHPEERKASSRASCAKWYGLHPEQYVVHSSKRRTAKYANTPIGEMLMSTEWLAILAEAAGHCHYCDKEAKLTLDHVIPLSRGGKHSKDNVVAACVHCNCSKGKQTLEEWLMSQTAVL